MAQNLLLGALLFFGAAMVMVNASVLIEVPKCGAYTVVRFDVPKSRLYARDLAWGQEKEDLFIEMLTKDFGVRFQNVGNNHFNITFYSGPKVSNMEIEDGKELESNNIVGIPVKNKLMMQPKQLNIRQTYTDGKFADISWTFQPDKMFISHISSGHIGVVELEKNDAFKA